MLETGLQSLARYPAAMLCILCIHLGAQPELDHVSDVERSVSWHWNVQTSVVLAAVQYDLCSCIQDTVSA